MTLQDFHDAEDWVYIDKVDELPSVRAIYCDTRDFGITVNDDPEYTDGHPTPWTGKYQSLINNPKCKPDFLIEKGEILKFLKLLENISGGKEDWRDLRFNDKVPDRSGWDFKYIRFYRYGCDSNKYIVTGSYGTAVHWRDLNAENIIDDCHAYSHGTKDDITIGIDPGQDKGDWTGYQTNDPRKQIGFKFKPTFNSCIDHFEIRGYDPKRKFMLTTVYPKSGEPFEDEIEEAYYDGAFETKDYVACG